MIKDLAADFLDHLKPVRSRPAVRLLVTSHNLDPLVIRSLHPPRPSRPLRELVARRALDLARFRSGTYENVGFQLSSIDDPPADLAFDRLASSVEAVAGALVPC
jgi:hypothetical protein